VNKKRPSKNSLEKKDKIEFEKIEQELLPFEEVLKHVPPDEREKVKEQIFEMTRFSGIMGTAQNVLMFKLLEKCDNEQFTKIIDNVEKQNIRDDQDRKHVRKHLTFNLGMVLGTLIAFGILVTFSQKPDDLKDYIELIALIAACIFGGWGWANRKRNK